MFRPILFLTLAAASCIPSLSAAIVGHTFSGKTYLNNATGFDTQFPVGTPWVLRVEWDNTAASTYLDDQQASYPLTKFTLTLKGKSGDWTTSSLPGKASFTLNRIPGFPDEIQFTSGWGPENHTNGTIASGQTYSVNLILGDPGNTALSTLSPIPGAIDPTQWSADKTKSYLKFYVTEMGQALYGEVDGLGQTSEPLVPEISVQQPLGKELKDGQSTVFFDPAKMETVGQTRTFVIRNKGTAKLRNLSLRIAGLHKNDYKATALSSSSIAPGGKLSFKVTFKPTASGKRKAIVKIESNDTNENPFTVALIGSGT